MANLVNNDKESKSEIEDCRDCITFKNKAMRRWKPQQPIYRPGSGPLRKSVQEVEENDLHTRLRHASINDCAESKSTRRRNDNLQYKNNNSENLNTVNQSDTGQDRRRNKKPEQPIYVPKPVAQARENSSANRNMPNKNISDDHRGNRKQDSRNNMSHHNGSTERLNYPKSKRFSANRRPDDDMDRRYTRQASEPRILGPPHLNRVRDTRSVEPAGNNVPHYQEKIQAKPPSGRRHSTIGLESGKGHKPPLNLENLAPRFRRKYLADNNIDPNTYPGVLEDNWDGSSITFDSQYRDSHNRNTQQCLPNYHQNAFIENRPSYPVPMYASNFPPQESNPPAVWSHTIPNTRVRGRGRLRPETVDNQVLRSLTPDRIMLLSPSSSRPCTPPPFAQKNKSVENINYIENRCHTPVSPKSNLMESSTGSFDSSRKNSPDNSASAPSLSSPKKSGNGQVRDEILDWSEEVEMNEKLEAGVLSDSMTRCSSVASLVEPTPQQQTPHKSRKHKKNRGNRNRSSSRHSRRDKSNDNQNKNNVSQEVDNNHNKQNNRRSSNKSKEMSKEKVDNDGFKVPEPRNRRRKNSFRDRSNERRNRRSQNDSRHSSLDRSRRDSYSETENWREEIRARCSSEKKEDIVLPEKKEDKPKAGIIILPQPQIDRSKPPVLQISETHPQKLKSSPGQQRTLYDPNNPNKPIIVTASNARIPNLETNQPEFFPEVQYTAQYTTDQYGNVGPAWYSHYSENFRTCRYPYHLLDVQKADFELQYIIKTGALLSNWNGSVAVLRKFFQDSLEYLLVKDIKFCQMENVEHHYWKILYYNIIEIMKKSIISDPENKNQYKSIILSLIDEGTKYFERLLEVLEDVYKFKLDNYLGINNYPPSKGLGFIGLALVSAQKIFLFLGDLARYKEKVNETTNYGKCRQWYIKAHEINPKNGRPYNQLALLAVYAIRQNSFQITKSTLSISEIEVESFHLELLRRKLDAVYYYMRSLMSSNPVQSAKESLISLFEENRKKYEQGERKRREEKAKLQMKEKESTQNHPGYLRREIWVHPDGGRRLHRTTSAQQETVLDSEEEGLSSLSSVEVNKRFITSYLHVHGKLITKIGMETFQHAALQMLREFRVLLQQSPVPLTCNRLLQLLALNMFAIDSTQLKVPELEPGCRSEVQERALVVSLQMFSIILERCIDLLKEHLRQQERDRLAGNSAQTLPLCPDLQVFLPAVKIWCDWMLCHSPVWNPPPSCSDYKIGSSGDAWDRLATLMNQLEKLEYQKPVLENSQSEDREMVRLPEDATMCGFIPLMFNCQPPIYVCKQVDSESAQMCVRIGRLLFFGTEFLCGMEPPVLKLQRYDTYSEYVSVVSTEARGSPPSPPELCNEDLLVESFSEDEDDHPLTSPVETPGEIRTLLDRKVELEKRQRTQELHRQRVQAILQQSVVSVEIEVRPRYLVPDTNCFIDYLERLQTLAKTHGPQPYTLMVPLVVLGELKGLTRGGKSPAPQTRISLDPEHMLRVAESARRALDFLHRRNPAVKCLTTKGTVLTSSTFTSEDEDRSLEDGPRNDDRILATCVSLCKNNESKSHPTSQQLSSDHQQTVEPRRIYREVVLLTEDRNLRVKALARDVPVRELPDFLQWAGLG